MKQVFKLDEVDFEKLLYFAENAFIRYTLKGDKEFKYLDLPKEKITNIEQVFNPYNIAIGEKVSITLGLPKPYEIEKIVLEQNALNYLSDLFPNKKACVYIDTAELCAFYSTYNDYLNGKEFLREQSLNHLKYFGVNLKTFNI